MAVTIAASVIAATLLLGLLVIVRVQRRRLERLQRELAALRAESVLSLATTQDERSRLIVALENSLDAIVALDSQGKVAFANAAAEGLLGKNRDELKGQPFVYLMPSEEVRQALQATQADGERHTALIDQPGRTYLRVFTAPVAGDVWSALVVINDLTDVKRTEQIRRDFVANVSHELRTPLASLKSVIETLESGALEDEVATRDFLGRADAEIERMVQIMEELLELSRIESGEIPMTKQPLNINDVAARAVERMQLQAERLDVQLSLETTRGLPLVDGDAERLERATLNLVQNALKFTPAGGSVCVETGVEHDGVALRVRDTGVGIAPTDLARVFERFYKVDRARSGKGTGLGLAIVKHTVEAHGGQVAVESHQGRGSVFSFTVPARPV
jgi:two-component system phosphate regulon sensor histidine kinase PhoR